MNVTFTTTPLLVTLAIFTTYIHLDPVGNTIEADKVFAVLSIVNIIRTPMFFTPGSDERNL